MLGALSNCRNNRHINTLLFLKITSINFCHRHIWNMGSLPPNKEFFLVQIQAITFSFLKLIDISTIITKVRSNMNYQLDEILSKWRNERKKSTSPFFPLGRISLPIDSSMYFLLGGISL